MVFNSNLSQVSCSGSHTCDMPNNQSAAHAVNTLQILAVTRRFDRDSTPPPVTIASYKLGCCRPAWLTYMSICQSWA